MAVDKYIFQQIVELMARREMALYLGPDLPETLSGVPGWPGLATRLAERADFSSSADWPVTAARYEQLAGRRNLIDWLDSQVNRRPPGPIYPLLPKLPVAKYVAATYDELLQSSLRTADREPNTVVEEADLSFVRPERPTVVKLFGEVSSGRRDALLLTTGDLRELARRRDAMLAQEVQPAFTGLSLLIIGQDLRADYFRDLYHRYALQAGALKRRSFAVWSGLEDWEIRDWAADQVEVLNADPLDLIQSLLSALEGNDASPRPTRPPESPPASPPSQTPPAPAPSTKPAPPSTVPPQKPGEVSQPAKAAEAPPTNAPPAIAFEQVPRMLLTFVTGIAVLALVFTLIARLVPEVPTLALVFVVLILVTVLVIVATLVVTRALSPEIGERLIQSVIQAVPFIGKLAGIPKADHPQKPEDRPKTSGRQ